MKRMKRNLKILHEMPDLEGMAAKHQDFDALLDAHATEKVRRQKRLRRNLTLWGAVLVTAVASWLYWGVLDRPENEVPAQATLEQTEEIPSKDPGVGNQTPVLEEDTTKAPDQTLTEKPQVEEPIKEEVVNPVAKNEEAEPQAKAEEEVLVAAEPETANKSQAEQKMVGISRDASPEKGMEHLYRYLYQEIELPDSLLWEKDALFLEIEFVVKKNGDITDISLEKELPEAIEKMLKSVIEQMPPWLPAMEKGDSVDYTVNLPITFQKSSN